MRGEAGRVRKTSENMKEFSKGSKRQTVFENGRASQARKGWEDPQPGKERCRRSPQGERETGGSSRDGGARQARPVLPPRVPPEPRALSSLDVAVIRLLGSDACLPQPEGGFEGGPGRLPTDLVINGLIF